MPASAQIRTAAAPLLHGIFRAVRDSGIAHVITKIELSNDSSRRAAGKAGFYEAADRRLER